MADTSWSSRLPGALQWSSEAGSDLPQVLSGAIGIAGPIAIGVALRDVSAGVAASLGGLAMSGVGTVDPSRRRPAMLATALLVGSVAVLAGTSIAGRGLLAGLAIVAIGAAVGVVGGFSRAMAEAGGRFLPFMIIAANLGRADLRPIAVTIVFAVGAVWTAVVLAALDRLLPEAWVRRGAVAAPSRTPSWRQRFRRWWTSLGSFSGWQYTARITLSLAVAEWIALRWGQRHSYWIPLTVAVVVHRRPSAALGRAIQRAAGTVMGVLVGSVFLLWHPSLWSMIGVIALLGGARPVLRAGNYAAYAAAMTPLVVLLMDFGRPTAPSVLLDRLLATLIGCGLALILGYAVWLPMLSRVEQPRTP